MSADNVSTRSDEQLWQSLDGSFGSSRAEILLELAGRAGTRDDADRALTLSEAALVAAQDGENDWLQRRAHHMVGIAYFHLREYESSAQSHLSGAQLAVRASEPEGVGFAYLLAAESLHSQGKLDEALQVIDLSIEAYLEAGVKGQPGGAYQLKGKILRDAGDTDDALEVLRLARADFSHDRLTDQALDVDDDTALILLQLNRAEEAVALLTNALYVAESRESADVGYLSYRLGCALRSKGEPEASQPYLQRALAHSIEQNSMVNVGMVYAEIAACEWDLEHEDAAFENLARARAHFEISGREADVRSSDETRASWLGLLGRHDEALPINRALALMDLGDMSYWARSKWANNLRELDRHSEALDVLAATDAESTPEIDHRTDSWPWMWRACVRAQCLEALGRLEEAGELAHRVLNLECPDTTPVVQAICHEIRSRTCTESDPDQSRADLIHAVALYLAADCADAAQRLAAQLLPTPSATVPE